LGYALDEALTWSPVAHVTVAEIEPTVVRWVREHGGERAGRGRRGRSAPAVRSSSSPTWPTLPARAVGAF